MGRLVGRKFDWKIEDSIIYSVVTKGSSMLVSENEAREIVTLSINIA
jgi:hypothetical protein